MKDEFWVPPQQTRTATRALHDNSVLACLANSSPSFSLQSSEGTRQALQVVCCVSVRGIVQQIHWRSDIEGFELIQHQLICHCMPCPLGAGCQVPAHKCPASPRPHHPCTRTCLGQRPFLHTRQKRNAGSRKRRKKSRKNKLKKKCEERRNKEETKHQEKKTGKPKQIM